MNDSSAEMFPWEATQWNEKREFGTSMTEFDTHDTFY